MDLDSAWRCSEHGRAIHAQAVSLFEASEAAGCWVAGYQAASALLKLRNMGAVPAQDANTRTYRQVLCCGEVCVWFVVWSISAAHGARARTLHVCACVAATPPGRLYCGIEWQHGSAHVCWP